jgi:hypothetical protein
LKSLPLGVRQGILKAMITKMEYTRRYWNAIRSSKYVIFKLGPVLTLLFLSLFGSIWTEHPELKRYAFWIAIIWLFVVMFWWSYDILNEELEKRDAEVLRTTPRAREDRAFRLLSRLLREGKRGLIGWTPNQIELWDNDVRLTLADWCQPAALELYLLNSRPINQERIADPRKALDQLDQIVNMNLSILIK